jgi:NAD(P)-dependent dehydrogenase (short-subunit alcohol dehydrogenase family)
MGGINLLVNCAGVIGAGRVLGKNGPMAGDFFTRVVHINLIGTFLCDKAAAAAMQQNAPNADGERGVDRAYVLGGRVRRPDRPGALRGDQAGVAGMTLPIARELAMFGIRVCSIAPGIFRHPCSRPCRRGAGLARQSRCPSRRVLGRPEEFASMVQTIVENAYLNGETIRLDGAIRMQPK